MASSIDVARRAGVSQSAVSRVFTPGASVSPRMRARVLSAAEALDYRPNALARSLITGRSRIVGLLVAYLYNQFYPLVLEKLCTALQAQNYHVLIFIVPRTAADIEGVLAEILDYQVDGIVLASVAISSALARRCAEEGVPVVLFNRAQDDAALPTVVSDNFSGGQRIAEFLLGAGHHRIAHIAGWEGASTQRDREAGFRAGLGTCRLFAREVGDFGYESAQAATRRMFARAPSPDAVFVANDYMAFAVMDVIRFELGLRIPQDVSVVGYDDVPQAAWPAYALTSFSQPADAMVEAAVAILIATIAGDVPPAPRITLSGSLAIRRSARIKEGLLP